MNIKLCHLEEMSDFDMGISGRRVSSFHQGTDAVLLNNGSGSPDHKWRFRNFYTLTFGNRYVIVDKGICGRQQQHLPDLNGFDPRGVVKPNARTE